MDPMLTKDDVCKMLAITDTTLKRLMQRREIQYYKVSGRVRFTQEDVDDYIRRVKVRAALPQTQFAQPADDKKGSGRHAMAYQTGYTPGMRVV